MLVAVAVVFRYAVMQARQATAAFGQLAPPTDRPTSAIAASELDMKRRKTNVPITIAPARPPSALQVDFSLVSFVLVICGILTST